MRHQIMTLVGNGFDIAVLKKYGKNKNITTSYDSFYAFFKYKYPDRTDNMLIGQMEEARESNRSDWSDFEAILDEYLTNLANTAVSDEKIDRLKTDLGEVQRAFSEFLNDIIDNDIISSISEATDKILDVWDVGTTRQICVNCAIMTLGIGFLKDLSKKQYGKMRFHDGFYLDDELKHIIINFNYTALLDNYLYLDKEKFNPNPYVTSDNNMKIYLKPNDAWQHEGLDYAMVKMLPIDIFHPHGVQDVPKSLLFGTENRVYNNLNDGRRAFVKSFWAQSAERYDKFFEETELFIVYGCSVGKSDNWWWSRIYRRLIGENPAELIIYNYGNEPKKDAMKDRFIENCCLPEHNTDEIDKAKENIYVVNFGPKKKIKFMALP